MIYLKLDYRFSRKDNRYNKNDVEPFHDRELERP